MPVTKLNISQQTLSLFFKLMLIAKSANKYIMWTSGTSFNLRHICDLQKRYLLKLLPGDWAGWTDWLVFFFALLSFSKILIFPFLFIGIPYFFEPNIHLQPMKNYPAVTTRGPHIQTYSDTTCPDNSTWNTREFAHWKQNHRGSRIIWYITYKNN